MYTYDLCICAAGADLAVAEALAASLRSYQPPRYAATSGSKHGDTKVLLDVNEEACDEAVKGLLGQSRCFLLLCSPDSRASAPVMERLHHFENTRGKESIIAVLVRGEPEEAFPPNFIEEKRVPHILPDGSLEERVETVEPVASDLRGQDKRHFKQLLRYETVRITATLLGLKPDELEQRQQKRRRRRLTILASAAASILLAVAMIIGFFALRAQHEGDIAVAQTELSLAVAERMMRELPAAFADHPQALLYVYDTLLDAVNSLYASGSANLLALNADAVLQIAAEDSPELMLRKATALRLIGSAGAAAAYEEALEALEADSSAKVHLQALLPLWLQGSSDGQPYGPGILLTGTAEAAQSGDIVTTLDGLPVGSIVDWRVYLETLAPQQQLTLTVLREEDGALKAQQIVMPAAELSGLSALGI